MPRALTDRPDIETERERALTHRVMIGRAMRYGHSKDTAIDAAQSARLALWRAGIWANPNAYPLHYINATIKHAIINEWRSWRTFYGRRGSKSKAHDLPLDIDRKDINGRAILDMQAPDNSEREGIGRAEAQCLVKRLSRRLSDGQMRILICIVCGRSERETGELLGIAQQTVNKHRRKIRTIIERGSLIK